MKIKLHSMTQLETFVNYCGGFDGDVDASIGSITVDAKSYMGIVGIGLNKGFEVTINENNDVVKSTFYSQLKKILEEV